MLAPIGKTEFLEVLPKWRLSELVHVLIIEASPREQSPSVAIQAQLVTAWCKDEKAHGRRVRKQAISKS